MATVTTATLKSTVKGIAGLKGHKLTAEQTDAFVAHVESKLPDWVLSQARTFCTPKAG